jgi:hypothetical protein
LFSGGADDLLHVQGVDGRYTSYVEST